MKQKNSSPKETLTDDICRRIRKDILAHVLKPGQKINLKDLCEMYEVSDTPIRIALNRLISEDLIENFPRQGMRVRALDQEFCKETFEIRRMIELYHAHDIMVAVNSNCTLRELLKVNMARHLSILDQLTPESDVELYMELTNCVIEFHHLLIKSIANRRLCNFYRNLNPFLYVNYIYDHQSIQRLTQNANEMQAILDALLNSDEELLIERLTEHLDNSTHSVLTILRTMHSEQDVAHFY